MLTRIYTNLLKKKLKPKSIKNFQLIMNQTTLNQHLTDMLDRLMNEDLTNDELKLEVTRAKAVADIATRKIENSKVMLQAVKVVSESEAYMPQVEKIIGIEKR